MYIYSIRNEILILFFCTSIDMNCPAFEKAFKILIFFFGQLFSLIIEEQKCKNLLFICNDTTQCEKLEVCPYLPDMKLHALFFLINIIYNNEYVLTVGIHIQNILIKDVRMILNSFINTLLLTIEDIYCGLILRKKEREMTFTLSDYIEKKSITNDLETFCSENQLEQPGLYKFEQNQKAKIKLQETRINVSQRFHQLFCFCGHMFDIQQFVKKLAHLLLQVLQINKKKNLKIRYHVLCIAKKNKKQNLKGNV
ncbi:hypothetical protein RFI_00941 [Reticulomyxa filosa]|uniref:Uncharacterized protein n=1 Tax=Reticulomyxa filosa TaxID=46433 RepID=X6PD22_RETFI|nr:hypothetical protein RFI_00941 [Reticulomyxa filosa]|eukprot:ETO36121.1 hypothetical protein RFI_00941 [Reticulomyxa filosa]